MFIDAVKMGLADLPDTPELDALRSQCRDFCAQEDTHRHVHAQYNAVLAQQGLHNHVEPRIWKRFKRVEHLLTARHQLAATAAYEHYTAVFAHISLAYPQMMAQAAPAMRSL